MNILHTRTDPTLLQRLEGMLSSSRGADIAMGYLFVSGFAAPTEKLGDLEKVCIVCDDRPVRRGTTCASSV